MGESPASVFSSDPNQILERTCFQTGQPWSEKGDLRSDVSLVYGIDSSLPQRIQTWRDHGYRIHVMTGVSWGQYQDYLYGRFDGINHEDEAQTVSDGHRSSHGGDVYYMCPSTNYGKFLCVGVQRALDAGAYGIVFPMCCCRQEAEDAVAACKYPPEGRRSVGGGLHALNFDTSPGDYYRRANDEILVIVQAEHISAVENADEIFSVKGLDGIFVGPNDLLASMGKTPAMDTDDPAFVDALRHIRETAVKHGIAPGLHVADAEAACRRIAEGWRFVAISSELGFMSQAARATARAVIGDEGREGVARY
jgi:4-hydroxy-2-oxoheptanedioate aldolase